MSGKRTLRKFKKQRERRGGFPQETGERKIQQKGIGTLLNATDLKESSEIGIEGTIGNLNLTGLVECEDQGKEIMGLIRV